MSIKTRFIMLPLIFTLAFYTVIMGIFEWSFAKRSLEILTNEQQNFIHSTSQTIDEYMNTSIRAILSLESMESVKMAPMSTSTYIPSKARDSFTENEVSAVFKKTLAIYPQFSHFHLLPVLTMKKNDTAPYISEAYLCPITFEPIISISTPIIKHDRSVGILVGAIPLANLYHKLSTLSYGTKGSTYIIDHNMNFIAHSDFSFYSPHHLQKADTAIAQYVINEKKTHKAVKMYDSLTKKYVYVTFKKSTLHDNWYIVSQIGTTEAMSSYHILFLIGFMISIGSFIFLLSFSIHNKRRLVRSFTFLHTLSKKIGLHDFALNKDEVIELSSLKKHNDEISTLLTSYESMMHQLHTSSLYEEQTAKDLIFLANHDTLTKLPNRRSFTKYLSSKLTDDHKAIVLLFDLDNFKVINDTLDHSFGDKVLQKLALQVQHSIYGASYLARFGGDEFILYIEYETQKDLEALLASIENQTSQHFFIDNIPVNLTLSAGLSLFPQHSTEVSGLLRFADMALASAKSSGKRCYHLFDFSMEDEIFRKTHIEKVLLDAIENDGFSIVYQPQVNLHTKKVVSYEALLRLKNNTYSPSVFIPIAEENGQIIRIGRYVTEEVIRQQKEWLNLGYDIKPIAINFSVNQLQDYDYIEFLQDCLSSYHLSPSYIELEITENIFIGYYHNANIFLDRIHQLGIHIAIDDFGTGYSSINYLFNLPIDKLKLDRSLSQKFLAPATKDTMQSIISLSHSLDLKVVAEGIEDLQDIHTLVDSGCDCVQGYFFSKPISASSTAEIFNHDYSHLLS